MHRVTNDCDAQTELFEWTSLQPFHGGEVVTCFDVVGCRERWSNAVGCEVTWGEVMWLVARCHVMSCDVIWCVFILCDAISCVVWCHVMHCDVMWCPLMWWAVICCEVMRCNGMRSYEFVMHCGWLRCHVVWFDMVVWGELEDDLVIRTTQIYSVLHSTTKYYSGTTLYYTVLLQYYSVLQSTTPVLILYYKVLLQYYSVLHSTTPVLLQYYSVLQSTTKYYSSTTPYYEVLLQYYAVLQSTTPVLLCTTKYYSSTSLYYKVLLQYYSVLRRTTPVLLCTTKYYSSTNSVLHSTTPVLLCTTQIYTSTTLYYKVLLQYYSVLQSTTPVLLLVLQSTHLQGAKHQRHQMLCLPRKVTLMIDPRHIWNVNYNAQSNRTHPQTSPNTAPATQNDSHGWCPSHMKRHLQCAEQQVSSTNVTKYCACHEKCLASLILVTRETSFTMRGTTSITLQPHQMLCLPRNMTRIIDPRDIWNVIYNARRNRHHPPTSPNTAPATQNDSHDWCPSHMTRHLQCAEQQISSSNITKCCACHAKWLASSILVTHETSFTMRGATSITLQPHQMLPLPRKMMRIIDCRRIWNVIYNARSNRHHPPTSPNTAPATQNCTPKSKKNLPKTVEASIPMRGRFEHDPSMIRPWSEHELVISHPPVRRGYFSRFGDAFCIENYNISRSGYLLKFHRILRLSRKVTLRHHQILRLPRKVTLRHHHVTELNCYWTVTQLLLNWPVTELLLNRAVTQLLLDCYWTVTELLELSLNCYWTELLLNFYWTVTGLSLNCYWTELTCYWAVRAVTELSCYWTFTELLLDCHSTVTELTCYWAITQLLLDCYWTVSELTCYWTVTELLLCSATWTVTVLDSLHF